MTKLILLPSTLLGLCAAAWAGPIGIGASTIDTGAGFREPSAVLSLDQIPADLAFQVDSMPKSLFDPDANDTTPHRGLVTSALTHDAEPPLGMMVMAGLGFFGFSRLLRIAPDFLRRFKKEKARGHRRRVKIQIRKMA